MDPQKENISITYNALERAKKITKKFLDLKHKSKDEAVNYLASVLNSLNLHRTGEVLLDDYIEFSVEELNYIYREITDLAFTAKAEDSPVSSAEKNIFLN